MSKDNISRDKVRITFKKTASRITHLSKEKEFSYEISPVKLGEDRSFNKVESNYSFVLEDKDEQTNYTKIGKVTVSKQHFSRITSRDKTDLTTLQIKSSKEFAKREIANSILLEIISKIGDQRTTSRMATYMKHPSSLNFKQSATDTINKSALFFNQSLKKKISDKNKNRRMTTIVKELELPVGPSLGKPQIESRPVFEQLISDTLVSTSSSILAESRRRRLSSPSSISGRSTRPAEGAGYKTDGEKQRIDSPFDLCWCFGFNPEVPVVNLSNDDCSQIVFANSQYAVIYDFHEDAMSFLQGHINTVSCISASPGGSLVATADSRADAGRCRVIVWDRRPCVLQVLDHVHPCGCQQLGFSPNGEFLVTVSYKEMPVCIKVWEWEKDNKNPAASIVLKESLGFVKKLATHVNSKSDFAVTFERSVVFAHVIWQTVLHEGSSEGRVSEKIKDCEIDISVMIPHKLGSLTDTTFLEGAESVALSSTCKGYVIVWEDGISLKHKKLYRKYVRLHLDCITNIQRVDNMIAVATDSGNVSFYDFELKILYTHKLNREPLVSLSFNLSTQGQSSAKCGEHPSCANTWRNEPRQLVDASLNNNPLSVRHFVVSTKTGRIAYVNASSGTPKYLLFPSKDVFTALDILPNGNLLCAGTDFGRCLLFDTDQRKLKITQQIKVQANSCTAISFLKYSPSGYILACGMYTGEIWLLDPLLLTPTIESPLTDCNCCITQMLFTSDSDYLLVTDVSFCISVYFLGEPPTLIGQYIAHSKPIVRTLIEVVDPGNKEKVFTLSADRNVCQFLIDKETKSFDFVNNQRVEQTAVPMYSVYYPYPYSSAGAYLGVNNEYKFRLMDSLPPVVGLQRSVHRRCRGTFTAPDYGSPINYMDIFEYENQSYLFIKTDHHIGIHLLPVDGNPFRALGFRASPTNITRCTIHPNGKYVFTISESCSGISMYRINIQAVEEFFKSGGEGLEPFLRMLSEEKEQEIRDYFDLGQFLHQGENPNLVRTLKNSLPICEVPNVLQALGCLLTMSDINELTNEVISTIPDSPTYNVEYDEFVRLYLSYRKRDHLSINDLRRAFRDFYNGVYFRPDSPMDVQIGDADPVFDSSSFIQKLLVTGEEMSAEELYAYFSILTGGHTEPPEEEHLIFQVPPTMPKELSFETFVRDILGFTVDDSVFDGTIARRQTKASRKTP